MCYVYEHTNLSITVIHNLIRLPATLGQFKDEKEVIIHTEKEVTREC